MHYILLKLISIAAKDYINVLHEVSRGHRELDVLLERELLPNASCREHGGGLAILRTHKNKETNQR